MSNFEITGTIRHLSPILPAGISGKNKRLVVLTIGDKHPQTVEFEAFGDKVDDLAKSNVGDEVEIKFELRGREWQKSKSDPVKFFNSLGLRSLRTLKAAPSPVGGDDAPF